MFDSIAICLFKVLTFVFIVLLAFYCGFAKSEVEYLVLHGCLFISAFSLFTFIAMDDGLMGTVKYLFLFCAAYISVIFIYISFFQEAIK